MKDLYQRLIALGYEEEDFVLYGDHNTDPKIEAWKAQREQPTMEALEAVTPEQMNDAVEQQRFQQLFNLSLRDRVLIEWIAQRTGGGTPQEIRQELLTIYRRRK